MTHTVRRWLGVNPNYESLDESFTHQVLFAVTETEAQEINLRPEGEPKALVRNIIKFHDLKTIAQWSVKAFGLEAIVAEFKTDRPIEEVLQALEQDQRVESVQRVNTYELLVHKNPYFHLQNTIPGSDLISVHDATTGKNVTVGIVDTGVDREHPELKDRIVYADNFVGHDQAEFDTDEHSTSVAGFIAAAANNNLGMVGVTPEAELMVFKACSQNDVTRRASCDSFSLMKALVDALKRQPDVLNLSFAGASDPLLTRLIQALMDKGVIIVEAVDHRNASTVFSASTPGVIAVCSAFQFDFDWMPADGVIAPGSEVLTATPGATYVFRSGSSLSTAVETGVAALLKEKDPDISGAELTRRLHDTASARINKVPMVNICGVVSVLQCVGDKSFAAAP